MKNYEKYADEIKGYKGNRFCADFVVKHIVKTSNCTTMDCDACKLLQMLWLLEDYKEPEVDWNNVKVDTPILVRDYEDQGWVRRHFAKYEDGAIFTWSGGETSWTSGCMIRWKYAKLAESEEE